MIANPPERLTELNIKHYTLKDDEKGYLENGDSDCYQHSHRNSHIARCFKLRVSSRKAE